MTRTSASLSDQLRRDWFRARFSWYMQDYPGREYRRIRRELRHELAGKDPDRTLGEVLDDLGHPRVLAGGYKAELPKHLPRYVTGAVAAGLTIGALAYLHLAYSLGAIGALESVGGGSFTSAPFGVVTTVTASDNRFEMELAPTGATWLINLGFGLVAFVLGSRLWRVLRRRA